MKLLDTTFLAHYYRGDPRVEAYLEEHDPADDGDLITTTINVEELAVGVHLVEDDPTEAAVVGDLGWLRIVPFGVDDAYHAGKIEARLLDDETVDADRIDALAGDILIAGAAESRDATVVTENVEDFRTLDAAVESY